jgi:glycosyltransferase involved in cell wall biosynthesis
VSAVHILFLSDNFPPETNAPATRLFEHARVWVRAGHRVTVVTCAPNFPEGRVYAGYRNRLLAREQIDGIDVVRVKTFIAANRGVVGRILDYLSFMVAGFLGGLFVRKPDVIVGTSPQFFAAVAAWALALVRRKPFVFELRDLWPESIRAVGAMRPSLALRCVEQLELFLYRRAIAVIAVTQAFQDDLVRRGIEREKVFVIHNGVDLTSYAPRPRDRALARELGVDGRFVVGYLGTHGLAHALERVLEAAELLREHRDIHFLFVGAGAARDGLVRKASELALDNVSFFPARPKLDMPRLWSVCDVALVHLKDSPTFATVVPSKIFECFGSGVPVLFAGPDGEGARIVREAQAGVVVDAEKPAKLAQAIEFLARDPHMCRELASASHGAAADYDREHLALRMLAVLVRCAGVGSAARQRARVRRRRAARRRARG